MKYVVYKGDSVCHLGMTVWGAFKIFFDEV